MAAQFLVRTVKYMVPVDRANPASIAAAYTKLSGIPGETEGVETDVSEPKFWTRPSE